MLNRLRDVLFIPYLIHVFIFLATLPPPLSHSDLHASFCRWKPILIFPKASSADVVPHHTELILNPLLALESPSKVARSFNPN